MVKFTWVSGGNGITPVKTPRPLARADRLRATTSRSSCSASSSSRSSGCWSSGCAAERPAASSTRCAGSEVAAASVGINPTRWRITAFALSAGHRRRRRWPARDAASSPRATAPYFVAQLGLVWVVLVVSLGSRTVEGAIQAAVGFIFFQRSSSRTGSRGWSTTRSGPVVLVIAPIIALRLATHRFVVPRSSRASSASRSSCTTSSVIPAGRSTRCRPVSRPCSSASVRSPTPSTPKACSSTTSASRSRGRRSWHRPAARRGAADPSRRPAARRRRVAVGRAGRSARDEPARGDRASRRTFAGITALDDVSLDVGERRDRRAHRAERRGQDDVLQLPARHPAARRRHVMFDGNDLTRVPTHRRARLGHRPHVPAHRAVRRHDAARAPARRRAGPQRLAAAFWKDVAQPRRRRRPTRASGRTEMLELLGLDAVADRPVESLSLGRRPAGRGRPGADDRAAAAAARRAVVGSRPRTRPRRSPTTLREVQRERGIRDPARRARRRVRPRASSSGCSCSTSAR